MSPNDSKLLISYLQMIGHVFKLMDILLEHVMKLGKIHDAAVALEPNQLFDGVVEVRNVHVDNAMKIGQVRLLARYFFTSSA